HPGGDGVFPGNGRSRPPADKDSSSKSLAAQTFPRHFFPVFRRRENRPKPYVQNKAPRLGWLGGAHPGQAAPSAPHGRHGKGHPRRDGLVISRFSFSVHRFLQLLAGLEGRDAGGFDVNRFPGLGIPTGARRPLPHFKIAETDQRNLLSPLEGFRDGFQHGVHHHTGFLFGLTRGGSHPFDQFGLVHGFHSFSRKLPTK